MTIRRIKRRNLYSRNFLEESNFSIFEKKVGDGPSPELCL